MQCAINYTFLNSKFCAKEVLYSSPPHFCAGTWLHFTAALKFPSFLLHHEFCFSWPLCIQTYKVYFSINFQRAVSVETVLQLHAQGCFYGLGNHHLGLNVPNSVFSELPGVCSLMAKEAEMFNELEMLRILDNGLWSKSAHCEDEGQQKTCPIFVVFFKQTC